MAFNPLAEVAAPVVFIIHRGNKNQKVKGYLRITQDFDQGKTWLVGEEVTGHYQVRGETLEVKKKIRLDVTGFIITKQ